MEQGLYIPPTEELISTALRTGIIFVYAFLVLRILGKKQGSQLSWFDILLIVSLGSAVGDVMIYPENTIPIISAMTAILVVIVIVKILSHLVQRSERLEGILEGQEALLVDKGKIISKAMNKETMTERELSTLLREKGYLTLKNIDKVYLETNGEISVIPKKRSK